MINKIKEIIGITILLLMFLVSCKTTQRTIRPEKKGPASEIERLESSALLIEGTRQKVKGNINRAIVNYAEAAKKDPENSAAFFELAKIHAMEGQYEDALIFAKRAYYLDQDNIYYTIVLADIYALNKEFNNTLFLERKLIENNPRNVQLYLSHAETLIYLNKLEDALEVYDKMEKNLGFSEELAIERQSVYIQLDRLDKAIAEVHKLVEMFPEELRYLDYLANLYMSAEMDDKAFEVYNQMLEADPENPYPLLLLADYFQTKGEKDKALEYVIGAFKSPSLESDSKERILFSYFHMSANDSIILKQAYLLCELFIAEHPNESEPYYIMGDFLFRDERFEDARDSYLKAVELYPGNIAVWEQILYVDAELKDYESMVSNATQALEYFFEYPLLFYYKSIAAYNLNDYSSVVDAMQNAILLVVDDNELISDFYTLKADAYNKLEMFQKSDEAYKEALRNNPLNPYALNNYSYSLSVRKENIEKAEDMSRLSNEILPEIAAFQDTYGWIMYQMGDYEQAYIWIKKALDNMEDDRPAIIEHFGDVLYKLGNKEKAYLYWERAYKAGEGSKFLEKKINEKKLYE